jgi:hypothetical protein
MPHMRLPPFAGRGGEAIDEAVQILAELDEVIVGHQSGVHVVTPCDVRRHDRSRSDDRVSVTARSNSSMVNASYAKAYVARGVPIA